MKKILVDLTPLYGRKKTGVELYGIEFYNALLKTQHEITPVFRCENSIDSNPKAIIIKCRNRLIVENFWLSKIVAKENPDIVFFPIFPPPLDIYRFSKIKIVPTIHDLAFRYYSSTLSLKSRIYLTPKYNCALRYASVIITISETIKSELSMISSASILNWGENISPVYKLEQDYSFDNRILLNYGLYNHEYLISVSTIEPRKNLMYLLSLFECILKYFPNLKLVLVGRNGWGKNVDLLDMITKLGESIIFTGYVSDVDLINLYHYSKSFVLLSKYEGFGRTPIEAYACGANVIVSDIPVFRETMGENAQYVNLNDKLLATMQLRKYLSSVNVVSNKNILSAFDKLDENMLNEINVLL